MEYVFVCTCMLLWFWLNLSIGGLSFFGILILGGWGSC